MKTTCICCGKRASHERIRSLGGTWYRCNICNYAWRGPRAYLRSVIANIWWPIKGPSLGDVAQRPLAGAQSPTSRSHASPPQEDPGPMGPVSSLDAAQRRLDRRHTRSRGAA